MRTEGGAHEPRHPTTPDGTQATDAASAYTVGYGRPPKHTRLRDDNRQLVANFGVPTHSGEIDYSTHISTATIPVVFPTG